tara:strand:- start:236 stop:1273 length:1038 start_codon:yes stop_codon:yes gene_type:complete
MAYITFQPHDHFKTLLYVGNGSDGHSVTGVGFKPDFVWTKNRDHAADNYIHDIVRGVEKAIRTNNNSATYDTSINLQSFDSDGFTLGTQDGLNKNGDNIVSWNWLAGGSQGSSNTDGSINTTYTSVNTTSGFSISTYTGTGSNATIGHGLGAVPQVVICKRLNSTGNWISYFKEVGEARYLYLDTTDAFTTNSTVWNDTAPTNQVFSVGTASNCNSSGGTYVAYCFAEKKGFSKFGGYTGNNNVDGNFIYLGFKPAWFLVKNTGSGSESWHLYDSKRLGYNPAHARLYPNLSNVEAAETKLDFVSNGVKIRSAGDGHLNSSSTFIYMAFAEEPLVSSNNVPATAR